VIASPNPRVFLVPLGPSDASPRRVTGLFIVALGGLAAYGGSRLPPVPGQQIEMLAGRQM
jgi:hypothetical protein